VRDQTNLPFLDFAVPARAPLPVTKAHAAYSASVALLSEARAAPATADAAIENGPRADAYKDGKTATLKSTHEAEARTAAAAHRLRVEALEVVVDTDGTAAAHAVDEAKAAWADELRKQAAVAELDYAQAIDDARAAAFTVTSARHDLAWLDGFVAYKLERGNADPGVQRVMNFREAQSYELKVPSAGTPLAPFDETIDAVELLNALARAVEPPAPNLDAVESAAA